MTIVFTVIEVTAGDPAQARDVVRVSASDTARGPVAIVWTASRTLSVQVPAALGVTMLPFEIPGLSLHVAADAGTP